MPARMRLNAWGQGAMKALIVIVIVIGILAILLILIEKVLSLVSGRPPENLSDIAEEVLFGICFIAFMATWLKERISGGRVLFDCGPLPDRYRYPYLLFAVFFLVMVVRGGFDAISVLFFWLAISCFIVATGRGQVKEKGIWRYWRLLRWSKIRSYRWKGDSKLLFWDKSFFSLYEETLHVPPEHRQAVDEFLRTHLSVQPTA